MSASFFDTSSSSDNDSDIDTLWREGDRKNKDDSTTMTLDETTTASSVAKSGSTTKKKLKPMKQSPGSQNKSKSGGIKKASKGVKRKLDCPGLGQVQGQSFVYDLQKIEPRKDGSNRVLRCLPFKETKNGTMQMLPPPLRFYPMYKIDKKTKPKKLNSPSANANANDAELLLVNAVTPLLRNAGWKINCNLSTYKFKINSTEYSIGKDQMLASMERIKPSLQIYGDSAILGTSQDPILETLILEDIMLAKNRRLIEIEEAVLSSLSTFDNDKQPKKFIEPSTQNNNDMPVHVHDAINVNETNSNSKRSQNTSNLADKNFIKIEQLIPKYAFDQKTILLDDHTISLIKGSVLEKYYTTNHHSKIAKKRLLRIQTCDVQGDPYSLAVIIKGLEQFVDEAKKQVLKVTEKFIAEFNVGAMQKDMKTWEIHLRIDATEGLGIKANVQTDNKHGLWFQCHANDQMDQILGGADLKGAVLWDLKVRDEWKKLGKLKDKNNAMKEALSNYQRSNDGNDKWVSARIYLSRDANLDGLDKSRIELRRRIGRPNKRKKGTIPPLQKASSFKNTSSIENKVLDTSQAVPPKKTRKEASTCRQHFVEKMKEVQEIEFKKYKIPKAIMNLVMWAMHKKLLGDVCDADCKCPSLVGMLTKDVIPRHLQVEEKNKNWANPFQLKSDCESMVGFSTKFCAKFYNKLCLHFPNDSPYQTLQRLTIAWRKHTEQLRFGIECKSDCPCGDSWETYFLPECEKYSIDGSSPILKSKNHTVSSNANVRTKDVSTSGSASQTRYEEFSVSLRPSKTSLGLFLTDDGRGSCIASSVDPNGFVKRKRKEFQTGTIVFAITESVTERKTINTWKEILDVYNSFKQVDRKLEIWFKAKIGKIGRDCSKEWTRHSGWIGSASIGWAGGSAVVSKDYRNNSKDELLKLGRAEHKKTMREKLAKQKVKDIMRSSSQNASAPNQPKRSSINGIAKLSRGDQSQNIQSILKKNNERRTNNRIVIDEGKNIYHLLKETSVVMSQTKRRVDQEHMMEAASSPKQSVAKLVPYLKQIPSTRDEFETLTQAMQTQIETHQELIKLSENQTEYDNLSNDLQILKDKKTALHLFEKAGDAIDTARYTKNPFMLQFVTTETQVNLTSKGEMHDADNYLFYSLHVNKILMKSTSVIPFHNQAKWPESNIENILYAWFKPSDDTKFNGEDIALIELRKGLPEGENIILGVISMKLSEIESELDLDESQTLPLQLSTTDFTEAGALTLKCTLTSATQEAIIRKKLEVATKLKDLIEWIKKFKQESESISRLIDADISSFGGVTLLHAAISCHDKDLVLELLEMGANKQTSCNSLGSPLDHAKQLLKDAIMERGTNKQKFHEIIRILDTN